MKAGAGAASVAPQLRAEAVRPNSMLGGWVLVLWVACHRGHVV